MLFVEKYRPNTIEETILPANIKARFQGMVNQGIIPTLLLTGHPGTGKTTVAMAMLEEMNAPYMIINGSLEGNIDTLRHDITQFASSVSMDGKRKYCIIDEADFLNPNSFQPALRNFLETFSNNCGFILTCNYPNRIIKEIRSRCSEIEFSVPTKEKDKLAFLQMRRACSILDQEGIEYDKDVIAQVVMKFFPDFRRTLGELQQYSSIGKIDIGILHSQHNLNVDELIEYMKAKNFTAVRKWVGENTQIPPHELFRVFYDKATGLIKKSSVPLLVVLIGKYQYQAAFVMDQEINTTAWLAELMADTEWM